jgi:CBS domain-containing protein
MTLVKHVLDIKGHYVHAIHPRARVFDALRMMAENNVGSLVVLEDEKLVGIFTERVYAREIALKGRTSSETLVADVMSTLVPCVRPEQSVEECMAIMTKRAVRHLPVLDSGLHNRIHQCVCLWTGDIELSEKIAFPLLLQPVSNSKKWLSRNFSRARFVVRPRQDKPPGCRRLRNRHPGDRA